MRSKNEQGKLAVETLRRTVADAAEIAEALGDAARAIDGFQPTGGAAELELVESFLADVATMASALQARVILARAVAHTLAPRSGSERGAS